VRQRAAAAGRGWQAVPAVSCESVSSLAVPQVDPGAHDPGTVLHRSRHAVRGPRFRLAPAAAQQREQLMPGGPRADRRDTGHLTALRPGHGRALQGILAAAAPQRPVPHLLIRILAELHRRTRLPLRPARLAAGLPAQRLRRRLCQPVRRRRLRRVRELDCTRAARSATRDCSPARCSRSTEISASCSAIRAFRSSSSSRGRASAARSPAASSAPPGTSGTRHTAPRPAATCKIDDHQTGNSQHQRLKKNGCSAGAAGRSRLSGDALARPAAGRAWDDTGCAYLADARGPGRTCRR
jgi:hypothetical protein